MRGGDRSGSLLKDDIFWGPKCDDVFNQMHAKRAPSASKPPVKRHPPDSLSQPRVRHYDPLPPLGRPALSLAHVHHGIGCLAPLPR